VAQVKGDEARFMVHTTVILSTHLFWDVTPCWWVISPRTALTVLGLFDLDV